MQYSGERSNLATDLAAAIRDLITDGDLAPGERINEVRLAIDLGVSRTPLREALTRLAAEGSVAAVPRIGFSVKPLSVDEYGQIVPIRALLESEALKAAGVPPKRTLERMASLERKIEGARTPGMVAALEDDWHLELIAMCPNPLLAGLVEQMMVRARRYELAFMREVAAPRPMDALAAIRDQLRAGDLGGASTSLREYLAAAAEPVIEWLAARPSDPIVGKSVQDRERFLALRGEQQRP